MMVIWLPEMCQWRDIKLFHQNFGLGRTLHHGQFGLGNTNFFRIKRTTTAPWFHCTCPPQPNLALAEFCTTHVAGLLSAVQVSLGSSRRWGLRLLWSTDSFLSSTTLASADLVPAKELAVAVQHLAYHQLLHVGRQGEPKESGTINIKDLAAKILGQNRQIRGRVHTYLKMQPGLLGTTRHHISLRRYLPFVL